MCEYITVGGLQVAAVLFHFMECEVLPGTWLALDNCWDGFGELVTDLAPRSAPQQ